MYVIHKSKNTLLCKNNTDQIPHPSKFKSNTIRVVMAYYAKKSNNHDVYTGNTEWHDNGQGLIR